VRCRDERGETTLRHLLAPIADALADAAVTEIVVQRPCEVGIERDGKWSWCQVADFDFARLDAIGCSTSTTLRTWGQVHGGQQLSLWNAHHDRREDRPRTFAILARSNRLTLTGGSVSSEPDEAL
jgi:hypothetical protein